MGRRSDHSRDELRDLILAATRELIARDGFRAVTARRIAQAIGYSPGTIYNFFTDLDDLVLHANAITLAELETVVAKVPITGQPADDLKRVAAAYIDYTASNEQLWSALFEHRLPTGEGVPDWYLREIAGSMLSVEKFLLPIFPDTDAARRSRAVRVLWLSLHGICTLTAAGKLDVVSGDSPQILVDMLIDNFLIGLTSDQT